MSEIFVHKEHHVDFCVVGGGLSGVCAALAAARHGAKVALMHDRPVLGGNASSEIRMWVCGAHGKNNRETGIIEELMLENLYRNPNRIYAIWDSILYEKMRFDPNITLLLNCSCNDAQMDGGRIVSVTGWQLTTQQKHTVYAKLFADCSGDSILAPLSGALYRYGRESSEEFGEDIAPKQADRKTMGMSCLMQARQLDHKVEFIPPKWANHYTKEDLPHRCSNLASAGENFWYMELGGENDCIEDTEELRDELLKVAFGIWDYVKNSGDCEADNWELDWVGFLPGKRESRRYVGDHIMTQHDVRAEGRFDDLIAYGGWTMDDHNPAGIRTKEPPTTYHPAPSPYGIPYRCIYSKNIENLFFAGRNISVTHTAMSSTRVMATCALLGQAAGTAAAIAVRDGLTPRGVYESRIRELQQALMDDDCYLPFHKRASSSLTLRGKLESDGCGVKNLTNGLERPIGEEDNGFWGDKGCAIYFRLPKVEHLHSCRLVFDSDLERETVGANKGEFHPMASNIPLHNSPYHVPQTMVRDFDISVKQNDGWKRVVQVSGNYQRMVRVPLDCTADEIKISFTETWGSDKIHLFSLDFI